jgi:two-component system nitrate/nitrite sensor histidine kinase NarX
MPPAIERWTLGAKLAAVGLPFVLLGLLLTALTLWASWQLDGGAAAVNEAGRIRMQTYRLAWQSTLGAPPAEHEALVAQYGASLALLRDGDPERPLVMPWDAEIRRRFAEVEQSWQQLRALYANPPQAVKPQLLDRATAAMVERIDALVSAVEVHLVRYTTLLHFMQIGLLVLGTIAASVLVVVGYHFVLEPVANLKHAVAQLQGGDLGARVDPGTSDELGALAVGFNDMAARLQASYADLEDRVRAKTAELSDQRERLQALYDITLVIGRAGSLQEMADAFTARVRETARADAAALRWANAGNDQFLLLAGAMLPEAMAHDEQCLAAGDCLCGRSSADSGSRVVPIHTLGPTRRGHCEKAGWATVIAVPIHVHERLIGELDLFYHAEVELHDAERTQLETLASHLATGMENLRLQAAEREAAVAEERAFLARELHDSIAQALAFLNIQAQLMRKAMAAGDRERMAQALAEIELGLRESHGDVRELLLHFRTRTNVEDIEHALQATLSKFEHQSGVSSTLTVHDQGMPLPADLQVQALHIVQEALSNVRKHAHAGHVWLDVWKRPGWRLRVRDDGIGFDPGSPDTSAETHVGLRIMRERAQRLGAALEVDSHPGAGTTVTLTLPTSARSAEPALEAGQPV